LTFTSRWEEFARGPSPLVIPTVTGTKAGVGNELTNIAWGSKISSFP
jgi:hypothetical protein